MDSYEDRMIGAAGDGGAFLSHLPMGESFTVKRVDLLRELTKQCRAAGMAVYAVSDMYLPADAVRALLDGCGFGRWDGVFV